MILPRFSKSVGTSEPREPAASRRENTILFTLAALQFIGFVDFMIVMPLGPQLLADLGVDDRSFSWVVSAHTLAAGLASFLAAPLLDRGSRKLVYIIVATGLLVGTAACVAAGRLPSLLAARCITGAFGGVLGALSLTIVVEMFSAERCGRAIGTLMSAFAVASTHLPAFGIAGAAPVVAALMAANAGRMVTALSLITASIAPRARGSFMSMNYSVQQIAIGMGAALGGMMVEGGAGEPPRHFGTVGIVAAGATISSLWLAARIRPTA
jgi:predicted MFS family arabinose efflux permease